METWDAIDSIRVVRDFADRPVEPDRLRRILNAGRRAGSSKNLQRWAFVVIDDPDTRKALSGVGHFAQPVARAPVVVALVTPDPHAEDAPLSVVFDVGRAAQNMVLTAWDMGIGSVPITVYEHDRARELIGYPEDHHCEYILCFGYPADASVLHAPKQRGGRRSLEEIVHHDRW